MREPLNKKIPIGLAPFQENGRSKRGVEPARSMIQPLPL